MSQPTDLVIPTAPKDYNKVPFVVRQVRKHINIETVHVIAPTAGIKCDGAVLHLDADVLPYDRDELPHRPSWTFQQMLKVFQDVTDNDWFLVLDADIFPVRDIPLWNADGKPILYLGIDQYYQPYFAFNEEMLGFGKVHKWSFLSECTLYSKSLVRDMLAFCGLTLDEFWKKSIEIIDKGCRMADSELYGSYVYRERPDVYEIRHLKSKLGGRYGARGWSDSEIESEIEKTKRDDPGAHLMSLHSWEGGA